MVTWDEKKRKKVIEDHGVDLAFRLITARLAERWMARRYERQRKRI